MGPASKQGPMKEIQHRLPRIMGHKYRQRSSDVRSSGRRESGRAADVRKLRKSTAELISRSVLLLLLLLLLPEQQASANNACDESSSQKIDAAQPLLKVEINLAAIQVACSPCVYNRGERNSVENREEH